jgi:hypothetical protein
MIYFVVFILIWASSKFKVTIYGLLSFLIALSGMSAYIIDKDIDYTSFADVSLALYSICFLIALIHPLKSIRAFDLRRMEILEVNEKFVTFIHFFGALSFVFSLLILSQSLEYFLSSINSVEEFKNEGEANSNLKGSVFALPLSVIRLFASFSVILIPIHFFFLVRKRYLNAVLFFLYSLILPLSGLFALSRSFLLQYLLAYVCLAILFSNVLLKKNRLSKGILFVTLIFGFHTINALIAKERFESTYYYDTRISANSLIQDKVVFSQFDYFSQWVSNGNDALLQFSREKLFYGLSFVPLSFRLGIVDKQSFFQRRTLVLGDYASTFNGIVSGYVYDFGFVGAFIIILLWSYHIPRVLATLYRRNVWIYYSFVGLVSIVCGCFFSGNVFMYEYVSIALILMYVFYKFKLISL